MTHAQIVKAPLPASRVVEFDALYRPGNRRRADRAWYDVFAIGPDRFAVSIGNVLDARGESVDLARAVRDAFAGETGAAPATSLLSVAERAFARYAGAPSTAFATALVGIINHAAGTFTYVSAGHRAPFIRYADGTVRPLPGGGLPIGLVENDHPPAAVVVDLCDAALVLLYSNGLIQAATDVETETARLAEVLADPRIAACGNPAAWVGRRMLGDSSHDDVAILALTLAGHRSGVGAGAPPTGERPRWSVSWSFDATGPASTGARRSFLGYLCAKTHGDASVDLAAAELIFGELLGNVVRHAPGLVEITLDWTADVPVLHVLDNGPGFHSRRSRERLPADDWSESGRGLFIVNACASDFRVRNRDGRGTHASATLPLA